MSMRLILALLLALPMVANAATVTHEVATPDTGGTPNTSGSFTPVAGDLLVVGVCVMGTTDVTATLSSSIGGFTFSQVETGPFTSGANQLYVYVANALVADTSPQTVTITMPADEGQGSSISVAAIAGISLDGLDAIVQDAEQLLSSGTPAPTFAGAADTGNPTLGFLCNTSNPATMTEPTGWTEAADIGFVTPDAGMQYVYRNSGFTGTAITWGSTVSNSTAVIIVEVDASAAGSPAEFVDVTVNAAADGYDIDYEVTGEDATVYAVACAPGDAAPNQAELEAGDCGGGNDALFAANEAATADVAADLALTEANNPPRLDVYVGCAGASGDCTLETHADEDRSPRTGFALIAHTSVAVTSICDLDSYFNPDCATGDVFEYEDDTNESADCNVSFEADGDFVLTPVGAGDCDGKRTFNVSYEDVSSATTGLFTAPTVGNFTTDDLVCNGNSAPTDVSEPEDDQTVLSEDEAMATIALSGRVFDEDGDVLTATVASGTPPNGTSIASDGDWTGTPDTEDEGGETLQVTFADDCGDSVTIEFIVYTVNTWTVPDLDGMTASEAADAIIVAAPWRELDVGLSISALTCDLGDSGLVLTQDPEAAAEAEPFDPISVTLSRSCSGGGLYDFNKFDFKIP